ncbi:MAG TPA: HD domain-containing phosphohydrolase, partial [Gemmatimonadales bacterium]|nr:HD domain-containing phosphohydrolase [Gemmatimonadales bacterium]
PGGSLPVMREPLRARILIVDEDTHTVGVLRAMLSKAGYRSVESTTDPRLAPHHARSFRPDLTLLALTPPFEESFAVMAALQALAEDDYLSILVMSASSERTMRLHALESGAKDFLAKPVDRLEAITRIRNLVEVRMLHSAALDQQRTLTETVALRTAELRAVNAELHGTRLEVILRLGRLAESHDQDAAGHIARVTAASARLGAELGLDAETCAHLFHASAMHDVGKIGISDQILRKKGRLDPVEMAIMRTHTSIGAEVLHGSGHALMMMAEEIALTHHEQWDGSGYPHGLRGDAIPLVGRIVTVCDVFDALTSVRAYKQAWSRADAMAHIRARSGIQFDPAVVRGFERVLPALATTYTSERMAG